MRIGGGRAKWRCLKMTVLIGYDPIADRFLLRVSILTRDIDIANLSVRPSVCLSVCLSVTFQYQIKKA